MLSAEIMKGFVFSMAHLKGPFSTLSNLLSTPQGTSGDNRGFPGQGDLETGGFQRNMEEYGDLYE